MNAIPPPNWATLPVASCNLLNLAAPGHVFYEGQPAYDDAEHERKIAWLGATLARLNADTELAGACFSPDGETLFVNAYAPGRTLAITGPWGHAPLDLV